MLASVRTMMDRIRRLDRDVRPLQDKQVFRAAIRRQAKDIVDGYFREHREQLVIAGLDVVSDIDSGMHQLLETAQRHSNAATYRAVLKQLDGGNLQSSGADATTLDGDQAIGAGESGLRPGRG
jgi:hypothetical protein